MSLPPLNGHVQPVGPVPEPVARRLNWGAVRVETPDDPDPVPDYPAGPTADPPADPVPDSPAAGPAAEPDRARAEDQVLLAGLIQHPHLARGLRGTDLDDGLFGYLTDLGLVWRAVSDYVAAHGTGPGPADLRLAAAAQAETNGPGAELARRTGSAEIVLPAVAVVEAVVADLGRVGPVPETRVVELLRARAGEFAREQVGAGVPFEQVLRTVRAAEPAARTRPRISAPGVPYTPEPVSWLIHGVLKRMTTLVAGPAQHLKSKLLLDMMVAIGTGGMCRALGHWQVAAPLDPGGRGERALDFVGTPIPEGERVLYLVGEDEDAEVEDMLHRICRARGTTRDRCGVTLVYDPPSISTGLDQIVGLIREHRSTVVVLDTVSALDILGEDADQSSNMHVVQRRIRELKRAVEGAGAVAFMVHHANKRFQGRVGQENYKPMVRTDIHGAGFVESAKQTVLVNRSREFVPGTDPEQVWVSTGNRSRSTLCRVTLDEGPFTRAGFRHHWVVTVEDQARVAAAAAEEGPAPTPRQAEAIADITAHLTEERGWVGSTDLRDVTGQSREVTEAALRILVRRGAVERGRQPQLGPGNYYRHATPPVRNLEIDPATPPEGGVEDEPEGDVENV